MKLLPVSLLTCALVFASTAFAAQAPAPKNTPIATVNMAAIVDQNPAASKAVEWQESMSAFQKELEAQKAPLEKLQADLQAEQVRLEAKKKEGKALTQEEQTSVVTKYQELASKSQKFEQDAQAKFTTLQTNFKNKLDAAVQAVAEKKVLTPYFLKSWSCTQKLLIFQLM